MKRQAGSWQERARGALCPGFSDYETYRGAGPLVIAGGEGVHVRDVEGRRYLEANSGLWNAMAGFDPGSLA